MAEDLVDKFRRETHFSNIKYKKSWICKLRSWGVDAQRFIFTHRGDSRNVKPLIFTVSSFPGRSATCT